jgi:hypothetical protein
MTNNAPGAVVWLLLLGAGVAMAQGQGNAPATKSAKVAATPQELLSQGTAIVRRGMAISQGIRTMLEEARKAGDIIKVTCLDEKYTQVNANLRNAERRLEALKQAVENDRRVHEYTVLTVLGQKLQVLDQEAHQCVGDALYETGDTKVVTEIDTNKLPYGETPSTPPVVPPPSLPTVPPPASATQ